MSDSDAYDETEYREEEYEVDDVDQNPAEKGKWVSALVSLLGLWMVVQAVLFEPVAGNYWSDVIVGIALIALGGYNYYRRANDELGSVSVGAFVALLGLWLMITPFILGAGTVDTAVTDDIEFWNDVVIGLAVLLLGAYSAYQARQTGVVRPERA